MQIYKSRVGISYRYLSAINLESTCSNHATRKGFLCTYMNYRTYVRVNPEFACIHVEETSPRVNKRTSLSSTEQTRGTTSKFAPPYTHTPKIFVIRQIPRSITPKSGCPRPQLQPERGGRKNCRRRVAPAAQTTWSKWNWPQNFPPK